MKLIKLTCPNCHANLDVDANEKELLCQYCRTKILLDDEIIKVEHTMINSFPEKGLKVAKTYLNDFEDYEQAYSKFKKLSEEHPYEPEVWWGLILSLTKKFTETELDYNGEPIIDLELCDGYFDKYLKVEKDLNRKEINLKEYLTYTENLKNTSEESKGELESYENDIRKIIIITTLIAIGTIVGLIAIFS